MNPESGGPIEGVKQIGLALRGVGVTIEVVCGDSPDAPWLPEFPFPIYALGPAYGRYGYAPDLADWLMRNATDYDAIAINGIWQYHGLILHAVTRRLGLGYFVYPHGMLDPWFNERYPLKHLKKRLYWRFGQYPVLRDAQAVLFTCEEEARLAKLSFRPNAWRSRVVNYGTGGSPGDAKCERQAFLARFPELENTRNILFLGRITAKKGVDILLNAFSQVSGGDPRLRLILAGPIDAAIDGPLRRLSDALNLGNRLIWTGMLGGDEKWGAFRAAEVFVLPSHQENFGISVAEALSCGVPTLITNKVNIWREVEDAHAGFVESDTLEGTTKLLEHWLAQSDSASAEMSLKARQLYCARFDVRQAAEFLLAALQE